MDLASAGASPLEEREGALEGFESSPPCTPEEAEEEERTPRSRVDPLALGAIPSPNPAPVPPRKQVV